MVVQSFAPQKLCGTSDPALRDRRVRKGRTLRYLFTLPLGILMPAFAAKVMASS